MDGQRQHFAGRRLSDGERTTDAALLVEGLLVERAGVVDHRFDVAVSKRSLQPVPAAGIDPDRVLLVDVVSIRQLRWCCDACQPLAQPGGVRAAFIVTVV